MTRSALERLRDARDYAQSALMNGGGLSAEDLAGASQPLHAVLFNLAVLGEALGRVPGSIQTLDLTIPWRAASDLRNLIIHAYWQIDLEIVAEVLNTRIEPLISSLDKLISLLEQEEPS